jgi:hypothetical protein
MPSALEKAKGEVTEALMAEGIALHGQLHKYGPAGLEGRPKGRTAALLRLSRDWRLIKYAKQLPPDLKLLNRLANLDATVFEEALRLKIINPVMTPQEVERLKAVG